MTEYTEYYSLEMPADDDLMSRGPNIFTTYWDTIEGAVSPPVEIGPGLPTTGNIGDRIYFQPHESIYICLQVDIYWGHIWRPVQAGLAPWTTVPDDVFIDPDYQNNPTYPLQFALDNKGFCHFRGSMRYVGTGSIADNISLSLLQNLPVGLQNHAAGTFSLALDAIQTGLTGLGACQVARWYIREDGYNSIRYGNSYTAVDTWFDGVQYSVGEGFYTNA